MRYLPDFYDEDTKTLYNNIVERFAAAGYAPEDVHRKIYMAVDLISTVSSDAILYRRPFSIEVIRGPLTEAAIAIFNNGAQKGESE